MLENCLHAYTKHNFGICKRFIFVDVKDSLIFNLLKTNDVHYILIQKMVSKQYKYVITHVKIPFYDVSKFLMCVDQLNKNMIICGYTDYHDFCTNDFRNIVKLMTSESSLMIEEV